MQNNNSENELLESIVSEQQAMIFRLQAGLRSLQVQVNGLEKGQVDTAGSLFNVKSNLFQLEKEVQKQDKEEDNNLLDLATEEIVSSAINWIVVGSLSFLFLFAGTIWKTSNMKFSFPVFSKSPIALSDSDQHN
jgi:hypothetical protein